MKNTSASKIYLINPPAPFLINDKNSLPYGLLYLSSFLKKHSIDVNIVDLAGLPPEEWSIPDDAKYYGVTATTPLFQTASRIASYIKKISFDAITILGGSHASAIPKSALMNSDFDVVVKGEGEETLLEIMEGKEIDNLVGIAFKDENGIKVNPPRSLISDIDQLPFVDITDVDYRSYNCQVFSFEQGRLIKGIDLITSRGCVYTCAFCASTQLWQSKIRYHSANYIKLLLKKFRNLGYNNFYFSDDFFTLRKDLGLILEDTKFSGSQFRCLMRADKISDNLVKKLYQGGCRQIDLGVESGSQAILDNVNKKITVEQQKTAIQTIQRNGIVCKIFLIIGLPGENQSTIDETLKFLDESNPDLISINLFVPLPGTPIWNNPQKYGLTIDDNIPFNQYIIGGKDRNITPVHSNKEELLKFQHQISQYIGKKDINIEINKRNKEQRKSQHEKF